MQIKNELRDRAETTRRVLACVVATALLASLAAAAGIVTITSTWSLGSDGNWNVATNWTPIGVPMNNASTDYEVIIDDAASDVTVTLDVNTTISTLRLDQGDALVMPNGRVITIDGGSIENDGTISLNSTGSLTRLLVGPDTMLSSPLGGGEMMMSSHSNNRIEALATGNRLTQTAGHSIRGGGQIGINGMSLTNQGLIDANDPAIQLTLDPATIGDFTNQSIFRASGGGTLGLNAGTYDNTAGLMEALDGSTIEINSGAVITGGELTTADTGVIRLSSLTATLIDLLNSGDLRIDNGVDPTIQGTIENTGTITFDSTTATTQLRLSGNVTLNGGGTVTMSSNINNRIEAFTTLDRLTNVDNVIQGAGRIGLNGMSLTNQSLIDANNPDVQLAFDPPTLGDFTNQSVFRASGGGTLELNAGSYDNTAGLMEALDGSTIEINSGAVITGGELTTSGSGAIRLSSVTATLIDLLNSGDLRIDNGVDPTIQGTIENTGTITFDSTTATTQLKISGDVTLNGGGTVAMSSNFNNRIEAPSTLDRLTNVDNVIQGGGQIGLNSMSLTNQSLIDANDPDVQLALDPPTSGDFTNQSIFRASGGGTLVLNAGSYDNTAGLMEALDDSTIDVKSGAVLTGGELTTSGTGVIRLSSVTATLIDLLTSGDLRIDNGVDPTIQGTIENTGTITFDSTTAVTQLRISGDTILTGGGTVTMSSNLGNRIEAFTTLDRLTNVDNLIQGAGQIGLNGMSFTNQGNVVANDPTVPLNFDPPTSGDLINEGLIQATGAAGSNILTGPMNQMGTVLVDSASQLTRTGDYTQTAGSTLVNGTLTVNSGVVDLQGGVLKGNGLVDGDIENDATVSPGESAGLLSVEGTYNQSTLGTLMIELGGLIPGTEHDVLAITGDAFLAGTLDIRVIDDFEPVAGQEFTILTTTGGTVNEQFEFVDCSTLYQITYEAEAVIISIVLAVRPADVNCDGTVDILDLLAVLAAWGDCPEPPADCPADVNDDGTVDVLDLLAVLADWG